MTPSKQITVLLAEDHSAVRQSLCNLLNADGGFLIVGEAKNGREAVRMARALRPDVVLMDISMPVLNGLEATEIITAAKVQTKVIVLSAYNDKEYIARAQEVGASGFVAKQTFAETLTDAIRGVMGGQYLFDGARVKPTAKKTSGGRDRRINPKGKSGDLTSLESEVMHLKAGGSANKQIAASLSITIRAVEAHLKALMGKLGLSGAAALVDYAIAAGDIQGSVVLTIT
jgi:DNA-binding NarL/FixJ family response regulator